MKVRILSGNARGQVVEMSQTEAEVNIATGYAEAVADVVVPAAETEAVAEAPEKEPPSRSRR